MANDLEMTINQALLRGIEAHKAGQAQEADRMYTAILRSQPKHPDANHNMGVLAVGLGKVQEALPFFEIALEANSSIAQFWISYIDALIRLDKLHDANSILVQAKASGIKSADIEKLDNRLKQLVKRTPQFLNTSQNVKKNEYNILEKMKLEKAIKLAKKNFKEGSIDSATRIYNDILAKYPKNRRAMDGLRRLSEQSSLPEFEKSKPTAQELQPLIEHYNSGKYNEALALVVKSLEKFPDSAALHNICGSTNKALGKLNEAIESYKRAIDIEPNNSDLYSNLGSTFKENGLLDEAEQYYSKALLINPKNTDALYNMGNALKESGDYLAAVKRYRQAVQLNPNRLDAHFNMGIALEKLGYTEQAINSYVSVLGINPKFALAYYNLGNILQQIRFSHPVSNLAEILCQLLDEKIYARPFSIGPAVISLIKLSSNFEDMSKIHSACKSTDALQKIISTLCKIPLLLKMMEICPIADVEIESILKFLRSQILNMINNLSNSQENLRFISALALQCFTNEYIYDETEEDKKNLKVLISEVSDTLAKGGQPSSTKIACLGCFSPLYKYEWHNNLNTEEISGLITRQVSEIKIENELKQSMPILSNITDTISTKVKAQYESYPYPRWVNLQLPMFAKTIRDVIEESKLKVYDPVIFDCLKPKVLVAGCGTGQHSIQTAKRFKDCHVLAIDLSTSSLAHAKRKSDEFGLRNIKYMQADILDLPKLSEQFDIIESFGVLHHMNDPIAGWQALIECLKPGGLMMISLYSELAREHIVKMREEVKIDNIAANKDEMRKFRQKVIDSESMHHKKILASPDFYSFGGLKDLIFHEQEHRFTIEQINNSLEKLNLKFCGYQAQEIIKKFVLEFPDEDDLYDIRKWHEFEIKYPDTFSNTDAFWCQKLTL